MQKQKYIQSRFPFLVHRQHKIDKFIKMWVGASINWPHFTLVVFLLIPVFSKWAPLFLILSLCTFYRAHRPYIYYGSNICNISQCIWPYINWTVRLSNSKIMIFCKVNVHTQTPFWSKIPCCLISEWNIAMKAEFFWYNAPNPLHRHRVKYWNSGCLQFSPQRALELTASDVHYTLKSIRTLSHMHFFWIWHGSAKMLPLR